MSELLPRGMRGSPARLFLLHLALASGAASWSADAQAQQWTITPRVTLEQSFTDNAFRTSDDEESDLITTVAPGISIYGQTERLELALDYSLARDQYWENDELSEFRHDLRGVGTLELIDESVFLDTSASISQELLRSGDALSAFDRTTPDNTTTVSTYTVSPVWRERQGNFSESELRYLFNQVLSTEDEVSDTTTHRATGILTSGEDFTRLRWVITLDESETDRSDEDKGDISTRLAEAAGEYRVNPLISVLGSGGYESIADKTLDEQPEGPIWSGGIGLRPGPRSTIRLLYNHRFEDDFVTGDANYLIGPETEIGASYTEDIQTSQSIFRDTLSLLSTDELGSFINARTEQLFRIGDTAFSLRDEAFRRKRFELFLTAVRGRNVIEGVAYQERREIELEQITEEVVSASLSWRRTLSPFVDLQAAARYYQLDFGTADGRVDDVVSGGIALGRRFSETLLGYVAYDAVFRDSNQPNGDLVENVITVGLRKTF